MNYEVVWSDRYQQMYIQDKGRLISDFTELYLTPKEYSILGVGALISGTVMVSLSGVAVQIKDSAYFEDKDDSPSEIPLWVMVEEGSVSSCLRSKKEPTATLYCGVMLRLDHFRLPIMEELISYYMDKSV